MQYREVMSELRKLGTAQNRKVYARHGVGEDMHGVSYANLGGLRKKIKTDHALALKLWVSGNHDARVLATMIADPDQMDSKGLESWAADLDNYVVTDAFSDLAAKSPLAHQKMQKWAKSPKEWIGRAGWSVLARLAQDPTALSEESCLAYLATIETRISQSKNRIRDAMNGALISIGLRGGQLEHEAIASAKRIGKVEVDHRETGCQTPDAVTYIQKARARLRKTRARPTKRPPAKNARAKRL